MTYFRLPTTPSRAFAAFMLVTVAALATSTIPSSAQADRPVPFKAGETLTYDVSWTTFVTAGQATLSVKERRPGAAGSARYYIVAEAQPSSVLQRLYRLHYKAESMLDTRTLRPSRATVFSDENGRTRHKTTTFRGNGTVDYEMKTASLVKSSLKIPIEVQDPLGAIYVLRAIPFKVGQKPFVIPVADSGKAYTMRVTVGARESVKTGIGIVSGIKLMLAVTGSDGKATDAPMTVWISDDARRLPLKFVAGLSVGSFQLTLARVTG